MKKSIKISIVVVIIITSVGIILFYLKDQNKKIISEVKYNYDGYIDLDNIDNVKIIDNQKYNNSEKISEDHIYKNYQVSNMKIYSKDGMSYLEFNFKNLSFESEYLERYILISFYDSDGDDFYDANYIIPNLCVGETKNETIILPYDITNAYDYLFVGL